MNCSNCQSRLHDYLDGELASSDANAIRVHVEGCAACRGQLEALRNLIGRAAALPREIAPARDLWREIRREIETQPTLIGSSPAKPQDLDRQRKSDKIAPFFRWFAPVAVAASVALSITLADRGDAVWSVAAVAGTPRVNARVVERESQFRRGQLLETDDTSRAVVSVGRIGEVTVEANSRLRLVGTSGRNHRLNLQQGTLHATIWAPPRLFFVDTPSATAVDLGCQYTLTSDDQGNGELHVITGYVALQHGARESIVPMGMKCVTRRQGGPGTPFAARAPAAFRAALLRFDFEPGAASAVLPEILATAGNDDTLTLWHLLTRTEGTQRAEVFDALARLAPPPADVTRAGILAGNAAMRKRWGSELGLSLFVLE